MQVASNGITLEVEDLGSGPPVLLVMGIGSQMVLWPPGFLEALRARGLRTIRFDNRETGLSTRLEHLGAPNIPALAARRLAHLAVPAPYTLVDMARDAEGVLDHLGLDDAHWVGISMGGMIVQEAAIHLPRRVRSLTTLASNPGSLRYGFPKPHALAALARNPKTDTADAYADAIVDFFKRCGSPGFPRQEDAVRGYAHEAYRRGRTTADGFARQFAAILAARDRTSRLRHFDKPTLLIHGSADPLLPPSGTRALARAMPHAEHQEIEGMGHDLPEALWTRIADAIARTVEKAA